jgi:hypothetical protein
VCLAQEGFADKANAYAGIGSFDSCPQACTAGANDDYIVFKCFEFRKCH